MPAMRVRRPQMKNIQKTGEVLGFTGEVLKSTGDVVMPRVAGYVARR